MLSIKEVNIAFINMHVPDFSMACEKVLGAFCFLNGLQVFCTSYTLWAWTIGPSMIVYQLMVVIHGI